MLLCLYYHSKSVRQLLCRLPVASFSYNVRSLFEDLEVFMIKSRLFTPGPVTLYPPALAAALEANIHYRSPEFKEILSKVVASLKWVLGNPDQVFLFASSGSGAMEAAVTNFFSPEDPVIIASCGKF